MNAAKALFRGIAICLFALLPSLASAQPLTVESGIQRVVASCMVAARNSDSASCVALVEAFIAELKAAGADASALASDIADLNIALVDATRSAQLQPGQLTFAFIRNRRGGRANV